MRRLYHTSEGYSACHFANLIKGTFKLFICLMSFSHAFHAVEKPKELIVSVYK